jgi:hypothetical protein
MRYHGGVGNLACCLVQTSSSSIWAIIGVGRWGYPMSEHNGSQRGGNFSCAAEAQLLADPWHVYVGATPEAISKTNANARFQRAVLTSVKPAADPLRGSVFASVSRTLPAVLPLPCHTCSPRHPTGSEGSTSLHVPPSGGQPGWLTQHRRASDLAYPTILLSCHGGKVARSWTMPWSSCPRRPLDAAIVDSPSRMRPNMALCWTCCARTYTRPGEN